MFLQLALIFFSIISALFATAVMSYIAMAVPIGPWIEATLVLLLSILVKVFITKVFSRRRLMALGTFAGGIAGIAATGCAFSFPTLYFLDSRYFSVLLSNPFKFSFIVGGLVFLSGALGLLVAEILRKELIEKQDLSFPIGSMVHKIIVAQDQMKKSFELLYGGLASLIFLVIQRPFFGIRPVLPHYLTLVQGKNVSLFTIPFKIPRITFQLSLFPLLFSIGFIAGNMIAIPLMVGAISKNMLLEPVNALFFPGLGWYEYVLAFCSGMVLQGALASFLQFPQASFSGKNKALGLDIQRYLDEYAGFSLLKWICFYLAYACFMSYVGIGILPQLFLFFGSLASAYQLSYIGGTIGLAPLGRYATFVMVPGVLLFGVDPILATVFATFVEIVGGVAVDSLFGYKAGKLLEIEKKEISRVQWLGLLVCSLSIGLIFYVLISKFGLGSEKLFAQKAQARSMLLSVNNFNMYVLFIGVLFGWVLKKFKINPVYVLTGILMPLDYSLCLVFGGFLAKYLKNAEALTPFFSGAFCVNSLWLLLTAIFGK